MKIEWNKVTWYSKIIALILFILLPFASFYLGTIYQKATSPTTVVENLTTATTSVKQTSYTKDCGRVNTRVNTTVALDEISNRVEDCFWNNYQNGTAATLSISSIGIDSGSTTYFSTDNNGKINGYSQPYVMMGKSEKDSFTCQNLIKDKNGLYAINCKFKSGAQDILIPSYR